MNKLMTLLLTVTLLAVFLQQSDAAFCWKKSYGRGVGTIPGDCKFNQEKQGLLCYKKCKSGYKGVLFVCWQNCPPRFTDTGGHCLKPKAYGRGTGYAIWSKGKCQIAHGSCEKWGLIWYPKCKSGFYAFGCCICSPKCVWGQTDIGVSCQKKSYTRATHGANCGRSKEYDAGLCYKRCRSGFYGVGPVCWGKCQGRTHVDCGAACASSSHECASKIVGMVESTLNMVATIAETAMTFGSSTIAKTAVKSSVKLAIKQAAKQAAKKMTKSEIKRILKKKAKEMGKDLAESAIDEFSKSVIKAQNGQDFSFDWTSLDPTGISSVVMAFKHSKC